MLTTLTVKNLAIISDLSLLFREGFTVITGETGAGKSLIMDAISFLLGNRASSNVIRSGEEQCEIVGTFNQVTQAVMTLLKKQKINPSDEIIIQRIIYQNGKSIQRVNGVMVSLHFLEILGERLVDIHTQNDNQKLFVRTTFLDFIDDKETSELVTLYRQLREEYISQLKKYKKILASAVKDDEEDLIQTYSELKEANIQKDEVNVLTKKIQYLETFAHKKKNLARINSLIVDNNILETVYEINASVKKLNNMSEEKSVGDIENQIESIYYDILDFTTSVKKMLKEFDLDENYFEELSKRLSYLKNLERKYKKSVECLEEYILILKNKIDQKDRLTFLIDELKKEIIFKHRNLVDISNSLTWMRIKKANNLVSIIKDTLKDLCLGNVKLHFDFIKGNCDDPFDPAPFLDRGIDQVDMMISFNPGEPQKSLTKVASGGELSRVMLALKTHLLTQYCLSTMIFDEIDTGISGEVGKAIACKLQHLSRSTQVLAISHLGVVAAAADQHLHIEKNIVNEKAIISSRYLDLENRTKVIAQMISSSPDYEEARNLAKKMIVKIAQ